MPGKAGPVPAGQSGHGYLASFFSRGAAFASSLTRQCHAVELGIQIVEAHLDVRQSLGQAHEIIARRHAELLAGPAAWSFPAFREMALMR